MVQNRGHSASSYMALISLGVFAMPNFSISAPSFEGDQLPAVPDSVVALCNKRSASSQFFKDW